MFRVKRINKEDVKPVKFIDVIEDKRPVRGATIFPEIYANIFFCARKKSGKTSAIYHTIENCATIETRVIAFCSTIHRDPSWRSIKKLCEDMKVKFYEYSSIKDPETKTDILDAIVKDLEQTTGDEKPFEEEKKPIDLIMTNFRFQNGAGKKPKPKKPKEKAPRIIFIFDDLSGELISPSVTQLLKKNRHFKSKVLISSQYWNDIALQARKQVDYVLLYGGLAKSIPKMRDIFKDLDLSIEFETFMQLYSFATKEKHHFLYIDVVNSEFRKDFNYELDPPKEEDEELAEREL